MRIPGFLLAVTLLLHSAEVISQADFRPGYYINNNQDTINGFINYRGEMRHTRYFDFKHDIRVDAIRLEPPDVIEYRFEKGKYYISKWIEIGENSELVFVEYLVNGIADLYYFRNEEQDHYLIEMDDGRLIELTNEERTMHIDGKTYQKESNEYIGVLKAAFAECQEIHEDIDDADLDHRSLINITSDYHDYVCDWEECIIYQREIPRIRFSISPTLGFSSTDLKLSNHHRYELFDFQRGLVPKIGLLLNLSAPRINDRISFQFEADYFSQYFYSYLEEPTSFGAIYYYDTHVNVSILRFMAAINYSFPMGRFRPFVGFGPMANYLISPDFRYTLEIESQSIVTTSQVYDDPVTNDIYGGFGQLGLDFDIFDRITMFSNVKFCYNWGWTEAITRLQTTSISFGVYLNVVQ